MWREGCIGIPDGKGGHIICHYWIKVYEKPSEQYGLEGGRISKLTIKIGGKVTANYDRGWDVQPTDEATKMAVQILLMEAKNEGEILKRQLSVECSFRSAWKNLGNDGRPTCQMCYIRAYYDGDRWWSTVFPINWNLKTDELAKEADDVYIAFQKAFPDLGAVRDYIEHDAERGDDPTEGNVYLEQEHGLYKFRMINRKGDYNLYLHVLSKAAFMEQTEGAPNG